MGCVMNKYSVAIGVVLLSCVSVVASADPCADAGYGYVFAIKLTLPPPTSHRIGTTVFYPNGMMLYAWPSISLNASVVCTNGNVITNISYPITGNGTPLDNSIFTWKTQDSNRVKVNNIGIVYPGIATTSGCSGITATYGDITSPPLKICLQTQNGP